MSTPSENRAPRIVLAGAVNSSRLTFEALLRHKAPLLGVLGLSPEPGRRASGYVDLVELAGSEGVPAVHFENINDTSVAQQVAGEGDLNLPAIVAKLNTAPNIAYGVLEIVGTKEMAVDEIDDVAKRSYDRFSALL